MIIILFITIILLLHWYNIYKTKSSSCCSYTFENYENNIIFLSKNELEDILTKDSDNYYSRFYNSDLIARKSSNITEYKEKIKQNTVDFTEKEKERIKNIIIQLDNKIKNISFPWFDGNKCNNIPWKFGLIDGTDYESGLSHTRYDTIIFSRHTLSHKTDSSFAKTLLHEKVHVYQKLYPNDVETYINMNNYKKIRKRSESDMIRANIDTDDWVYVDKNNKEHKCVYFNNKPYSLSDVYYNPCNEQKCEHPYEKMAIEISEKI